MHALAVTIHFMILMLAGCQDVQVNCLFSEECLLPCSFTISEEEVIHWKRQDINVHSFYYGTDQLQVQNSQYNGRTYLFKDLIAQGNASLLLQRTKISDEGQYSCYTSTTQGSREVFISVNVKAPIQFVVIERTDDRVSCVIEGTYPAPHVSWSTYPPTALDTLQNWNQATNNSEGLYFVKSTVKMLENLSEHTYICSVSTTDGAWTASLRQLGDIHGKAGQTLPIPCPVQKSSLQDFTLSWTFKGSGNASLMLQQDTGKAQPDIQPPWEHWVQGVSGDGSLLLQNLEGPELTGTYTCLFSATRTQHLVKTNITIEGAESGNVIITAVIIVAVIAVIIAVAVIVLWKTGRLQKSSQPPKADNSTEMSPLK
ncbi:hypothetical protein COCON_G00063770 [Conger conger]|uniref:Ig-like domain-containing protein n=1 Tax=Conger conger TaxID=82655 RepID=A0A9Q1DS05_CONCO|nr:hypothetical protein COCON_G00063770 [Conger conger]